MNDLQSLKIRLENLKKTGSKTITLDIDWLLKCINQFPVSVSFAPQRNSNRMNMDGGSFSDE